MYRHVRKGHRGLFAGLPVRKSKKSVGSDDFFAYLAILPYLCAQFKATKREKNIPKHFFSYREIAFVRI